jgi:ferrous iron transport protein B
VKDCHDDGAAVAPARGASPPAGPPPPPLARLRRVALAGNPNVGKSSLFNRLTGLHQKVTNYPGVTVERKAGTAATPAGPVEILDLPGSYSLSPHTLDEEVVRDEILGRRGEPRPDMVVLVLDATNLARNLFLTLQVLGTGIPAAVALNCVDAAAAEGIEVDAAALSRLLGVPVVPTVGRTGEGVEALRRAIAEGGRPGTPHEPRWRPEVEAAAAMLAGPLAGALGGRDEARRRLPEVLGSEALFGEMCAALPPDLAERARRERASLPARGIDAATATAEARYALVDSLVAECVRAPLARLSWRERLDRLFTHRLWGTLALLAVFTLLFQAVFSWSGPLMDGVDWLFGALGRLLAAELSPGLPREFLVDGLLPGFSGVLVFVPQIAVMFLLIEVLDDSGYLARAAFLLDRLMGKAGLPGRAFLPLVSSFACAIPGVMATRTIKDPRDRLATIFAAPFMSCSARLPVYALVIGALFSGGTVLGFLSTGAAIMIAMYLLGIAAGLLTAGLLRRTVLRGGRSPLLLELPGYRWPAPRSVALEVGRRTWLFVSRAGPVILGLSVVLWFLAAFPREAAWERDYAGMEAAVRAEAAAAPEEGRAAVLASGMAGVDRLRNSERLSKSYAGRLGRLMEPVLLPLGFDWKMGIGIVASFAAREVFVSTLGVVYAAGDEGSGNSLREAIRADVDPATGRPVFRPLVGISLLVFFVLAMQCMSTLAVVRRETGSWKWPLLMLAWMTGLAYAASLLVYQAGSALGF